MTQKPGVSRPGNDLADCFSARFLIPHRYFHTWNNVGDRVLHVLASLINHWAITRIPVVCLLPSTAIGRRKRSDELRRYAFCATIIYYWGPVSRNDAEAEANQEEGRGLHALRARPLSPLTIAFTTDSWPRIFSSASAVSRSRNCRRCISLPIDVYYFRLYDRDRAIERTNGTRKTGVVLGMVEHAIKYFYRPYVVHNCSSSETFLAGSYIIHGSRFRFYPFTRSDDIYIYPTGTEIKNFFFYSSNSALRSIVFIGYSLGLNTVGNSLRKLSLKIPKGKR